MKTKERKILAQKIAQAERAKEECTSSRERTQLEMEIINLCSKVTNVEEMIIIDEMVQDLLSKNS